jgi:hypothetical protein
MGASHSVLRLRVDGNIPEPLTLPPVWDVDSWDDIVAHDRIQLSYDGTSEYVPVSTIVSALEKNQNVSVAADKMHAVFIRRLIASELYRQLRFDLIDSWADVVFTE